MTSIIDDTVYASFDEAPLDDPGQEGDNSVLASFTAAGIPGDPTAPVLLAPQTASPIEGPRTLIIPHPRDLKYGMKGLDVLALKRAGRKAGFKGLAMTQGFGGTLQKDLKTFQHNHGLTPDGVYGRATHRKLARYYDKYGIYLINHAVIQVPWRSKILTAAMISYNERWKIHYTQGPARMWLVNHHIKDPKKIYGIPSIYEDCSSFATWLYYQANMPDPNGFGYNGLGYTGTLANHGHFSTASIAKVGALHFYGWGFPYKHVTINVGNGRCVSHGSEMGPVVTSVWYRSDLRLTKEFG